MAQMPDDMPIVAVDRAQNLGEFRRLYSEQMTIIQRLYRSIFNDINTKEWVYFTKNGKKWRAGSDPSSDNFLFQYLASGDWKIQSNWVTTFAIAPIGPVVDDTYGHIYIPGVDVEVVIGSANPHEIKNAAGDGWSVGEVNRVTFPTGGTEHYLTVTEAGKYDVVWSYSAHTDSGGASVIHGGVMIDDVAVRNEGEDHSHVGNANDDQSLSAVNIIDCPNGNEEISLWTTDDNSRNVHIEHANMRIRKIKSA